MFHKILFATTASPASDDAAHVAFDLSKKYKAEIKVFHTFGLHSRGFSSIIKNNRTGKKP